MRSRVIGTAEITPSKELTRGWHALRCATLQNLVIYNLQHPNHNCIQSFWNFAILKINKLYARCVDLSLYDFIAVLLLYPLAAIQMWHQTQYGKLKHAGRGGTDMELKVPTSVTASCAVDNMDDSEKGDPAPSCEIAEV